MSWDTLILGAFAASVNACAIMFSSWLMSKAIRKLDGKEKGDEQKKS